MTETIEVEEPADHVRVLILNRPDQLNALDYPLVGALHDALDAAAADDDCRVIVLTGAGRGFCAGLDLRDYGAPPEVGEHRHRHAGVTPQAFLANLTQHIHDTPQVVIASINGAAFGGGLALAAACDLRLASASATFCSAFIRTGLTGTDVGITYFLPRLIGASRAFDMILSGRTVDAAEAERMGLVSRVLPDDELVGATLELASKIAGYTAFGLRRTKEVMWHNLEAPSLASAIAMENRNQELGVQDPEVLDYMSNYSQRHQRG
ncbi:MAG: enoyl-CoA hydratase/isomerase family protein [Acidimicrobiia bacterium]|nr:enoyl-CoA hydratase/isomerase family protein [Acidimicrobiia bacterium]